MGKEVIKLNESQLRKIIAESVKKILSETDWKTYYNAYRKAYANGDPRWEAFKEKAEEEFNSMYGYKKGGYENGEGVYLGNNGVKGWQNSTSKQGQHTRFKQNYAYRQGGQGGQSAGSTITYSDAYGPHGGSFEDVYNDGGNTQAYTDHFSGNMRDKYLAADAEHQNHINGNYTYDNEKGWHLKNQSKKP